MAKHHPDLIFCRKQAGVGKNECWVALQRSGIRNGAVVYNIYTYMHELGVSCYPIATLLVWLASLAVSVVVDYNFYVFLLITGDKVFL